eukprot:47216-Eustigmatos_ZCMA.PRE.1
MSRTAWGTTDNVVIYSDGLGIEQHSAGDEKRTVVMRRKTVPMQEARHFSSTLCMMDDSSNAWVRKNLLIQDVNVRRRTWLPQQQWA